MDIDEDKIDGAVLALLWLTLRDGRRTWKGFDFDGGGAAAVRGALSGTVCAAAAITTFCAFQVHGKSPSILLDGDRLCRPAHRQAKRAGRRRSSRLYIVAARCPPRSEKWSSMAFRAGKAGQNLKPAPTVTFRSTARLCPVCDIVRAGKFDPNKGDGHGP